MEETEKPALDLVKELIQRLKLGDAAPGTPVSKEQKEQKNDRETIGGPNSLLNMGRKDLDFTDRLWNILCQCVSNRELVECLKHVFTVLSNCELNPMVHRQNNSTMAELVRDSYSGKLRTPNLAGVYPLQLLAEMGAEKLKRDYKFALLSRDLVSASSLEPLIGTNTSLSKTYDHLERLQAVVDMIELLNTYLKVPYSNLSPCAKEMLQYYERNKMSATHTFTFTLPTNVVKDQLDEMNPYQWGLEITQKVQSKVQSMMYILMAYSPFPHLDSMGKCNGHTTLQGSESDTFNDAPYYFVRKEESLSYL